MSLLSTAKTQQIIQVQYQRPLPNGAWRRSQTELVDGDAGSFEALGIEDLGHEGDHHIVQIRVADTDAQLAKTRCDWALLETFGGEIMEGVSS